MKRTVMLLMLMSISCVLALLMAEWVVRLRGVAPNVAFLDEAGFQLSGNKTLAYEMRAPLGADQQPLPFEDKPGRLNRWGFRDREHAPDKTPGTLRILVLGDSIAFGLRVDLQADTFPAKLEQNLRSAGVPAEVINFGVPGYNTGQEVELLKTRGLALQPDIVLVAFCLNDYVGVSDEVLYPLLQKSRGDASLGKPWFRRAVAHSALWRLVRYRLLPDLLRQSSAEELLKEYNQADTVPVALQELARLQALYGFRALVVLFPFLEGLDNYQHADEHQKLGALCAQAGLPMLDLLPALRECSGGDAARIAADLFHPNLEGHACTADALDQYLRGAGFLALPAGAHAPADSGP